jgi:hypothetical protein
MFLRFLTLQIWLVGEGFYDFCQQRCWYFNVYVSCIKMPFEWRKFEKAIFSHLDRIFIVKSFEWCWSSFVMGQVRLFSDSTLDFGADSAHRSFFPLRFS